MCGAFTRNVVRIFGTYNTYKSLKHDEVNRKPVAGMNTDVITIEPRYEKINNKVPEQVRHKPSCTSTEDD